MLVVLDIPLVFLVFPGLVLPVGVRVLLEDGMELSLLLLDGGVGDPERGGREPLPKGLLSALIFLVVPHAILPLLEVLCREPYQHQ